MDDRSELWVAQLGRLPYADALALQEEIRALRQADQIPDTLLLLEHPPVYTRGRRTLPADLPMGDDWYLMQGIEIHDVDRGGRVTYHGPGQLVGYPIMKIGDVVEYLRTMERGLIAALGDEGVEAQIRDGLTGVWVDDRKIGSIGVHVQKGVTTHGWAINVDNDLQPFEWIIPCGIDNVRMTSLYKETGRTGGMGCFRKRAAWRFADAYGLRQRIVSLDRLRSAAPVASGVA
jgi:lipoyl(octanoyl) transferase